MRVTVKSIGAKELFKRLVAMEDAARDMSKFWRGVGDWFVTRTIKERFEKEQSPDGVKWAPWSEKYRKRMERSGKGGNKILADTGELRRSLNRTEFKDRVVVGSALSYAATHQFGDARRNIPARPFLGVTEADRDEIVRRLKMYFDRAVKRGR